MASMIATLYSYKPVIAGVMKLGADKLFLLIDNHPDESQRKGINTVKKTLEDFVIVKTIETDVYDIIKIAKKSIEIIDSLPLKEKIILNVSAARKTKAFGLLFAGYARSERISKIVYVTKEEGKIVSLPKLSFNLNGNQKKLLKHLSENDGLMISEIVKKTNISRAMVYRHLKLLKDRGFIENKGETKLTDSGKIAVL